MEEFKIENVVVGGIDTSDAPEFVDAFIESATSNGIPLNEEELEVLNEDTDFVHEQVLAHLY